MNHTTSTINYRNFLYPPGGILIWIIILLEVVTFLMALGAFAYYGKENIELFRESKSQLNSTIGAINTFILLTSGFFAALSSEAYKNSEYSKSSKLLLFAIAGGLAFILLKSIEYSHKIESGLTMNTNIFYTFYWLLTVFHLMHVVVGIAILGVLSFKIKKVKAEGDDVEAGIAFWHLCDLIWLMLFPSLYLIF